MNFFMNHLMVPFTNWDVIMPLIGNMIISVGISLFFVKVIMNEYMKKSGKIADKVNLWCWYTINAQLLAMFFCLLFWYFALPFGIIYVLGMYRVFVKESDEIKPKISILLFVSAIIFLVIITINYVSGGNYKFF